VAVVLNRVNRAAEVQPELARRVLSCGLADAAIPAGFRDLENAINSGVPERISSGPITDGIERLAVEVGARPERPRRLRRRSSNEDRRVEESQKGQVAVETMGLAGVIALLVLALWQIVLVGYTFVLAGHSAREAARAVAVGDEGETMARAEVPGAWRDGLRYSDSHGDADDEAHAEVSLAVPALMPGLETPLRVTVDESTVIEGESLPESVRGDDEPTPAPGELPPSDEPPPEDEEAAVQ
jgi:pilus assembly protein CpaE